MLTSCRRIRALRCRARRHIPGVESILDVAATTHSGRRRREPLPDAGGSEPLPDADPSHATGAVILILVLQVQLPAAAVAGDVSGTTLSTVAARMAIFRSNSLLVPLLDCQGFECGGWVSCFGCKFLHKPHGSAILSCASDSEI